MVFMGLIPEDGGLITSPLIENYSGTEKAILGCCLLEQALANNIELLYKSVSNIAINNGKIFTVNYINEEQLITKVY